MWGQQSLGCWGRMLWVGGVKDKVIDSRQKMYLHQEIHCIWCKFIFSPQSRLTSDSLVEMCWEWKSRHLRDRSCKAKWQCLASTDCWSHLNTKMGFIWACSHKSLERKAPFDLSSIALFLNNLDVTHCSKVKGLALLSQCKQGLCLCQAGSSNPDYTHINMRRRSAPVSYKGSRKRKH